MNHWIVSLLSIAALVPSYGVSAASFRKCDAPELRTDGKYPDLVCGQRGEPKKGQTYTHTRRLYTASADDCLLQCYSYYDCGVSVWNSKKSACLLLSGTIKTSEFNQNDTSRFVFSNRRCINPPTGCDGLWNPSFDTPNIHGKGLQVRPTRAAYGLQQVFLQPWATFQNVDKTGSEYGWARRGSTSDLPKNHDPVPSKNGADFLIIRSKSDVPQYMIQLMAFALNTTYNFEFTYSILRYEVAPVANDNSYDFVWASPWLSNEQNVMASVTFDQTGVDGKWHTVSGSFTTVSSVPANWFDGESNAFVMAILPYYVNGTYVPGSGGSASVAVDNLKITEAPQGTTPTNVNSFRKKPLTKKLMTSFPPRN